MLLLSELLYLQLVMAGLFLLQMKADQEEWSKSSTIVYMQQLICI